MTSIGKKSSYHKNYYPQERAGICVVLHDGEDFESLFKRFRKKYSKSGLAKEFRDRMYYEKPSDKRRRKKAQSIRMIQREKEKAEAMQKKYLKMKNKRKKQMEKRKVKGGSYDSSSGRQNNRRGYEKK